MPSGGTTTSRNVAMRPNVLPSYYAHAVFPRRMLTREVFAISLHILIDDGVLVIAVVLETQENGAHWLNVVKASSPSVSIIGSMQVSQSGSPTASHQDPETTSGARPHSTSSNRRQYVSVHNILTHAERKKKAPPSVCVRNLKRIA